MEKLDVRNTDAAPCKELGNGGQVLEPKEDRIGTGGDTHVGEQRNRGCDTDAEVRNTSLRALEKELRSLVILSNGEEITGTSVQEGVGR